MSGYLVTPTATVVSYTVGSTPQDTFVVPFPFDDDDDLTVAVDGAAVLFSLTAVILDSGFYTGSSVVLTAPVSDAVVVIRRRTKLEQEALFAEAGAFSVATLNLEIGRLWMGLQDLESLTDLAIRVPDNEGFISELPDAATRAGKVLGFDDDGAIELLGFDANGIQGPRGEQGPAGNSIPAGTVMSWPAAVPPAGWLFANGAAVSRADYSTLFGVIGTTYGAGNGSTTFNLPDLRARMVLHRDTMNSSLTSRVTSATSGIDAPTLGATGGDQRLHLHTHGITDPQHTHGGGASSNGEHDHEQGSESLYNNFGGGTLEGGRTYSAGSNNSYVGQNTSTEANHTHTITISAASTGVSVQSSGAGSSQNMPPVLVMNAIIYAGGALAGTGDVGPHLHPISEIVDLQSELDTLAAAISAATVELPIAQSDVTGLTAALAALEARPISPYVHISGTGSNSEEYFRCIVPACSFPSGAAGSHGNAGSAATGSTTFTAYKNGVSFATFVFGASGDTATVTIGSTTSFNGTSDVLTISGPATADATLANIGLRLSGTYS